MASMANTEGSMSSFKIHGSIMLSASVSEKDLVIPEGVERIWSDVFKNCDCLESVVLSSKVVQILDHAFANCPNLRRVTLPAELYSIDDGVFAGCSCLEEIDLPEELGEIGSEWGDDHEGAFENCVALRHISIPAGTLIGVRTFRGCTALESVTIAAKGASEIAEGAFEGCTALKEIVIPQGVQGIQYNAFSGCTSLESVVLPDGLKYIHAWAFENCTALKKIVIPQSVERIDGMAFAGCTALEEVIYSEEHTQLQPDSFENTPVQAGIRARAEEKEAAFRAIKERPRRKLTNEQVRALDKIYIDGNLLISAIFYRSGYRGLGGSNAYSEWITEVDETYSLAELDGKPPQQGFGMYLRAVVDDTVYLTYGLGANAGVYSFNEDGRYEEPYGAYDTQGSITIGAISRKK